MNSKAWAAVRVAFLFAVAVVFATLSAVAPANAAPFSALAVDARTGEILFAKDIDGPRYPASLTKMMTLYIVFQELKAGRISKTTPITFSKFAASRAPSKLGVRPGGTITIDQAIRALVTKSANDVAAALAENLGGSEPAFAQRMTKTARALGMSRTTFRNASGLPDPQQRTTARDMATLGLRLQRDFPEYFGYFKLPSFAFQGRDIRNHNRLLGKLDGIDGIKTGYTAASGFNLVSSAGRGDRRIVGVVMGGATGNARNRYMAAMVEGAFKKAKGGTQIALAPGMAPGSAPSTMVAAAETKKPKRDTSQPKERSPDVSTPDPDMSLVPAQVTADNDQEGNSGSGDESNAQDEAAVTGTPAVAAMQPQQPAQAQPQLPQAVAPPAAFVAVDASQAPQAAKPVVTAAAPGVYTMAGLVESVSGKSDSLFAQRKEAAAATAAQPITLPPTTGTSAAEVTAKSLAAATTKTARKATTIEEQPKPVSDEPVTQTNTASIAPSDDSEEVRSTTWSIQIGAFPSEDAAKKRLQAAKAAAGKQLAGRKPLTLSAKKDGQTLIRARYSGFNEKQARDACKALTRKGLSCFEIAPQS
ncbi:MAG: D-alanyl-D-alanine carboxypeptidase [Hyphomicrobiales bacterium]